MTFGTWLARVWAFIATPLAYIVGALVLFAILATGWFMVTGHSLRESVALTYNAGRDLVVSVTGGSNSDNAPQEQPTQHNPQSQPQAEATPPAPSSAVAWYDQEQTRRERSRRGRVTQQNQLKERKLDAALDNDLTLSAEGTPKTRTGIRIAVWEPGVEKGESLTSPTHICLEVAGEELVREKEMTLPGYDRTWAPPLPPATPIKIWAETDDGRTISEIVLETPTTGRIQVDLTLPAAAATAVAGTP
ncbi:hypothetical protein HY375_02275 [Candidatus Berkelbacteria bacterium]|nr:hypothetical protein [Candidatus Berkelbacteria bacterium]